MLSGKGMKREFIETGDDGSASEIYRFKILLPNGTAIGLNLRNPAPEMTFDDFIGLVKKEYFRVIRNSESMKRKRPVHWLVLDRLFLRDAYDAKIRSIMNFKNFKPHKCHILRLYDGCGEFTGTFENMWDLTPDTDLVKEIPEAYSYETALAELIDNSLQAVWSNSRNARRLISVDVFKDSISIFDTGPGMDDSDENSIVKWGKLGASLNRSSKQQAIGGKPPYLTPSFGMFGYGGPFASMHLGRHALVSSKTRHSKKVYTLRLEREALLSSSGSELKWKTGGGIRDPLEDELARAPQGSFTKVEIFEPKKSLDIFKLQCRLKDIYFPYIQCDELSSKGRTITPVEFQINGVGLAEIEGGEVAITNLHSCNGPDFVLELHFSIKQDSGIKTPGSSSNQEANARLKCVYFPVIDGKEKIEKILEKLQADGHEITEKFETFSRVSIRRLGRLLPDARWAWLPFMDLRHKKGSSKAQLLKKCCSRVKCFVDTDAGMNPTPSKTDLAHKNPFTIALKRFGNNFHDIEKGIDIKVYRDGKSLSPSQLERDYQDWILHMHRQYDEEVDRGEDEPVLVVSPLKGKSIGISSDVARVHRILKRKGETWKSGQKVKILKGACAGVHKQNVYATLEFFVLGGFQGDAGGEAQIICRPLGTPKKDGCILSRYDGEIALDIRSSMSIPISVIDSEKLVPVESVEWKNQVEKWLQKLPSTIDLLSRKECQQLKVDGEELPATAIAGTFSSKEVVAVVRPANYGSKSSSKDLDQKYIFKCNIEMSLKVKCNGNHVYSVRVQPSSHEGIHGIYVFQLRRRFPNLFQKAGVYTFSFSLTDSSCKSFVKKVEVDASPAIGSWRLLSNKPSLPYSVRVGSSCEPLFIECYDIYNNRTTFTSKPEVMVKLQANKGAVFHVENFKTDLSVTKSTLEVGDLLIVSDDLDKIRPVYEATLVISSPDDELSVSIPCRVTPGYLQRVKAQPSILANRLLPGCIIKELELEIFDAYGNHAVKGSEVQLHLEGFQILDQLGLKRKVDDHGCVDLSSLLKVTAGCGQDVSLSVSSNNKVFFKKQFQTERRELRIASTVPEVLQAGSTLENINFEIVNSDGVVDDTIHYEVKSGELHLLTIKADWLNTEDSIRYTFKNGCCTVPAIPIPQREGSFRFLAHHSLDSNLSLIVEFNVVKPALQTLKVQHDEFQSSTSDGNLPESFSLNEVGKNFITSIENNKKGLEDEICQLGLLIGDLEKNLAACKEEKEKIDHNIKELQGSIEPYPLGYRVPTKEELMEEIEKADNSAAAVLCKLSRGIPFREPQNHLMRDIIGLVVLLGRVKSIQLSRILSEYLGEDQMLAIVSRTFEAAAALERYEQDGEVDRSHALHAEAAALERPINGRFLVICLEDISPCSFVIDNSNYQRKLALPVPNLDDGTIPTGFLGFAVNMIDLDTDQLSIKTQSGHGLRETLFYRLFGQLQVYKTREHMIAARACIEHAAVSLDGGIMKENGLISLGFGHPNIRFQVVPMKSEPQPLLVFQENIKLLEEKKSELRRITDSMNEVTKLSEKVHKKFRKRNDKYNKLMEAAEQMLGKK